MRTGLGFLTGVSGNTPQVQQFFNRLATLPTTARQILYANLINALVAGGVWSGALDALWVAGADGATTLTELISGTVVASLNGSPAFTADRGFTCTSGAVTDIQTTFNPSAGSQNYSQNSAFLGAWNLATLSISGEVDLIRTAAGNNVFLGFINTKAFTNLNDATAGAEGVYSTTVGWFSGNRPSSTTESVLQNNSVLDTASFNSASPENGTLNWWGNAVGQQFAAVAFGKALSSGRQTTLYNALQTYLHAIGAV